MQTLLDRKDRMSMYHGLEVRVPFCDYRIAEYLYSVPWSLRIIRAEKRVCSRKAVEGSAAGENTVAKKSPYPKTHNPAYLKAVSQKLSEIINNPASAPFADSKKGGA
jgi:asparagine synthase (glutamine-hydrolysing)